MCCRFCYLGFDKRYDTVLKETVYLSDLVSVLKLPALRRREVANRARIEAIDSGRTDPGQCNGCTMIGSVSTKAAAEDAEFTKHLTAKYVSPQPCAFTRASVRASCPSLCMVVSVRLPPWLLLFVCLFVFV